MKWHLWAMFGPSDADEAGAERKLRCCWSLQARYLAGQGQDDETCIFKAYRYGFLQQLFPTVLRWSLSRSCMTFWPS